MRPLALPLALAIALQTATAAQGATVASGDYRAVPGERNDVVVREVQHGDDPFNTSWTITDRTAPLTPEGSCLAIDAHTVTCDRGISFHVELGDGNDTVRFEFVGPADAPPQQWVTVAAGAGEDTVRGGPGVNRLYGGAGDDLMIAGGPRSRFVTGDVVSGGPGDDRLRGGPASEVLRGGGGHDVLRGHGGPDTLVDGDDDRKTGDAGVGPDILDGGPGIDTVSYAKRTVGVSVDLRRGISGEGDVLSKIESVVGGHEDDRLVVVGDTRCGGGDDQVDNGFRPGALLHRDCETIVLRGSDTLAAYPVDVSVSAATFEISCPAAGPTCAAAVRLREATGRHRLLARGAMPAGTGPRQVRATFTALAHRVASQHHGRLSATVRLAGYYSDGPAPQWSIRLKIPG